MTATLPRLAIPGARRRAAVLAALLAWPGLGALASGAAVRIEPGREFSLRPGQSAVLADGSLQVGFDAVVADSRCPKGERCVWAGEARVRVWVQPAAGARGQHELREGEGTTAAGRELRLVRLEPQPVSGRPIAAAAYRATLLLAPPGSGAPATGAGVPTER